MTKGLPATLPVPDARMISRCWLVGLRDEMIGMKRTVLTPWISACRHQRPISLTQDLVLTLGCRMHLLPAQPPLLDLKGRRRA